MLSSVRAFLWRMLHFTRRTKAEAGLEGELQFHLQMELQQNLRQGMTPEEARRQALMSLGGLEQTREACRETLSIRWVAEFRQDLRYGWRMMCKSPRFTAIAVLTLALGIGANAAIFSAVNGILLQPLPYPDSSRLVTIKRQQIAWGIRFGELREIERQCTALERIEISDGAWLSLGTAEGTRHLSGTYVSSGFFSMLGVKPLLGRPILPEDTQPGNDRVAVLSYHLWRDQFGGDPAIVGRGITIGNTPYTVVGVMPGEFGLGVDFGYQLSFGSPDGIWLPRAASQPGALNRRAGNSIVARLKKDATAAQADAQLQPLSKRFAAAFPPRAAGLNLNARSLDPGIAPRVRTILLILLGGVGFVLVMACVNVTSLLVARLWTRQRELAIRKALGASRFRIARQLLSESLLLAFAGGAGGLLFSVWGIQLLRVLAPPYTPRVDRILLDARVLGFTMVVSLLSAVLVGLAPALQASSRSTADALKTGSGGSFAGIDGKRQHQLRSALVVLEVLLAVILVAGGALMGRSFHRLMRINTGLSADNVLTLRVGFSDSISHSSDWASMSAVAAQDVLDGIRSLPGVGRAALSDGGPFSGSRGIGHYPGSGRSGLYIDGISGDQLPAEDWITGTSVTPGLFGTLGIRLLRGRDFEPGDPAGSVAIVSQGFARTYIPGDPLGIRFATNEDSDGGHRWMEIIGVVNDVRDRALTEPSPVFYTPFGSSSQGFTIIAQTPGNPMPLVPAIKRIVRAADKDAQIDHVATVDQILGDSAAEPRFQTALVGSFGALALVLAVIGVYGVISHSVVQQTHEIGVRMALGAQARDVLLMILRQGMLLATAGIVVGMGGAMGLTRVLRSMLYEIEPTDPATFAGVALFLVLATLAACYIPARRATKVDPMTALRHE